MTPAELERLHHDPCTISRTVGVQPGGPRTLLYGYDTDRRTWHLYQNGGWLTRVIYIGDNREPEHKVTGERLDVRCLVPNKRLYPEACDYEFCRTLKSLEVYLPFTTYGTFERPAWLHFYGRVF